jgi:hypothetical protein
VTGYRKPDEVWRLGSERSLEVVVRRLIDVTIHKKASHLPALYASISGTSGNGLSGSGLDGSGFIVSGSSV